MTELQEIEKSARELLPRQEADDLVKFVRDADRRIRALETEARVQKARADKVALPEGTTVLRAPDNSTVVVLRGLSVAQRRDIRDTFRKNLLASNDPALAPARALDANFPHFGEAVIREVGPDGMLTGDDTVTKSRGETWRQDIFAASLRGGAVLS